METKSYNILVVDDSTTFTRALSDKIHHLIPDVIVRTANSGMEAIRVLGNNDIDLVLMDVFMPVFDGIEMAKIIRSNYRTQNIPIIFITGADPEEEFKSKALEIGGIDYISKSIDDKGLLRLLNLYLRFIKWEKEANIKMQNYINDLNNEIILRQDIERKLLETTMKLQESNQTKDKFFSIIAHDLKNPLSSFRNVAVVLANEFKEMSDNELSEFLNILQESSTNIYNLLENLLSWSRSQLGVMQANPVVFELNRIVMDLNDFIKTSADEKKIDLIVNVDPSIELFADSNMISTVIRNLATNAIKFTKIGGKVEIKAVRNNHDVVISVTDNGLGMSKDEISKLYRLDKTKKSKLGTNMEPGTGLGLIICNEFITLHNSTIKIESEVDKGSTFSFVLTSAKK